MNTTVISILAELKAAYESDGVNLTESEIRKPVRWWDDHLIVGTLEVVRNGVGLSVLHTDGAAYRRQALLNLGALCIRALIALDNKYRRAELSENTKKVVKETVPHLEYP